MLNRNVSILSLAAVTALMLFNFQNCAPAAQLANKANPLDSEVRIVDDWSKTEIQFVTDSVQVHDEAATAGIQGICNREHNGAGLKWALYGDDTGHAPLVIGDSVCKSGQFSVTVNNLDNIVCGIPHRLAVEGDWGGIAATQFEKRCQPLASEHVAAPESSPMGTDCSLEYVPAEGPSDSCAQVCYRDSKVVYNVKVDAQRCSGLIQKLASP